MANEFLSEPTTGSPAVAGVPHTASHEVRLTSNVVYGEGRVGFTSVAPQRRALLMDVRQPLGAGPWPGIVLAFGGAFHRGDKVTDSFTAGERRNTPVSQYAQHWAERGFVTFSIDYRLVQEDPDPGSTVCVAEVEATGTQRMDAVRSLLGLGPATPEMLWRGVEAASDDLAAAATYVSRHADRWQLDPRRLGVWGWSAGGRMALNAVFCERCPAAALVACSGFMALPDLERCFAAGAPRPATLLVTAERDLPHIRAQGPVLADWLAPRLDSFGALVVRNADHFYPWDSEVGGDGRWSRGTLLDSVTSFFERQLAP